MDSLVSFFRQSQLDKKAFTKEMTYDAPRNFESFMFGEINGRRYYTIRDEARGQTEFVLRFPNKDFIAVDAAIEDRTFWKFGSEPTFLLPPQLVEPGLTMLFLFVYTEAWRRGIRGFYGSFQHHADRGFTNEPIIHVLQHYRCMLDTSNPNKPNFIQWLTHPRTLLDQAWHAAGIKNPSTLRSVDYTGSDQYHFICATAPKGDFYRYQLQTDPKHYCRLLCQIRGAELILTQPLNCSVHPAPFERLLQQITFDAIHGNTPAVMREIRCIPGRDHLSLIEPILTALEFEPHPTDADQFYLVL